MKAEERTRYFQELARCLRHEGLTPKPGTADGFLPVELDSMYLCRVSDAGTVRYWPEDTADEYRSAALDKVVDLAKAIREYMRQMEAAPLLMADDLSGDYRLLELIPSAGSMSAAEIDRQLEELNREFQTLFADSRDGGFMKHAEAFKRISDDMAALKKQRAKLLDQQNSSSAAGGRIASAMEILTTGSDEIRWDESVIRQLVDTVKVLSATRIRVYLRGGIEIEQELG